MKSKFKPLAVHVPGDRVWEYFNLRGLALSLAYTISFRRNPKEPCFVTAAKVVGFAPLFVSVGVEF